MVIKVVSLVVYGYMNITLYTATKKKNETKFDDWNLIFLSYITLTIGMLFMITKWGFTSFGSIIAIVEVLLSIFCVLPPTWKRRKEKNENDVLKNN